MRGSDPFFTFFKRVLSVRKIDFFKKRAKKSEAD